MVPALSLRSITKRYRSPSLGALAPVTVLRDISLDVSLGEIVVVAIAGLLSNSWSIIISLYAASQGNHVPPLPQRMTDPALNRGLLVPNCPKQP